jgi:hypothetical protein
VKLHSTNYFNTFIQVAEDCPATAAEVPPNKNLATIARLQYEMIHDHPYRYTSDDVLFEVYAQRQGFSEKDYTTQREKFFSKGQPCMRSSPLPKRYGWGIYSNHEGKLALVAIEDVRYRMLASDTTIRQLMAMRSKRP